MLGKFCKHLAALIYDLFILAALAIAWTGVCLALTHGHAIPPGTGWYQFSLLILLVFYYYFSWRFGRQTIGMRAWKLSWA